MSHFSAAAAAVNTIPNMLLCPLQSHKFWSASRAYALDRGLCGRTDRLLAQSDTAALIYIGSEGVTIGLSELSKLCKLFFQCRSHHHPTSISPCLAITANSQKMTMCRRLLRHKKQTSVDIMRGSSGLHNLLLSMLVLAWFSESCAETPAPPVYPIDRRRPFPRFF